MIPAILLVQSPDAASQPWYLRPETAYPSAIAALCILALLVIIAPKWAASWRARGKQGVLDPLQVEEIIMSNNPLILDIRDPEDYRGKTGHLRGALPIPFAEVRQRMEEFRSKEPRPIIIVDDTDKRAYLIYNLLRENGFTWIYVLKGGIRAWKRERMPLYH